MRGFGRTVPVFMVLCRPEYPLAWLSLSVFLSSNLQGLLYLYNSYYHINGGTRSDQTLLDFRLSAQKEKWANLNTASHPIIIFGSGCLIVAPQSAVRRLRGDYIHILHTDTYVCKPSTLALGLKTS